MGVRHLASVLSLLLVSSHVFSFSITKRSDSKTDLSDALAILQRQRRRADADDYYGSERLLESRPLTLEDVSDWLSREGQDGVDDLDSEWVSDRGDFKSFDDEPDLSSYDLGPLMMAPEEKEPETEVASKGELDDIFSDDNESNTNDAMKAPEKKKKEEMMNVKGEKKNIKKKSSGSEPSLSLDTLTKDEYNALMKAVEKLQRQAEKLSNDSPAESMEDHETAKETILEAMPLENSEETPVSEEELTTVFSDSNNEPVVKETKITEETVPGPNGENVILKTVETETEPVDKEADEALKEAIATEMEEEMKDAEEAEEKITEDIQALEDSEPELSVVPEKIEDLEKYWLLNDYMDKSNLQKRTAKRAVIFPERLLDEAGEAVQAAIEEENRELDVEAERQFQAEAARQAEEELEEEEAEEADSDIGPVVDGNKIPVEMFLMKILQLQSEVDRLKTVARLEDLENDVLTDALNEATLGQKEGTVSDLEFDSLQEAIQLEEALQELKAYSKSGKRIPAEYDDDATERKRKRRPESRTGNGSPRRVTDVTDLGFAKKSSDSILSSEEVENLIDQAYRKQDDDIEDGETASLFLRDADSCPAVREYSTNCELADMYALPVDYEARALCNLHQMCYSCGHSLRIQQDHCDFVYRAAATALCDEKEACVVESEIFLRTMKLKTRYVPHTQPYCRSTCAAQFLGMV